jgi:hypothetical protein
MVVSNIHDWFWQLQAAGQGSDWFFVASFVEDDADCLTEYIKRQSLPDFTYYRVNNGPCRRHQHTATYDLYIDQGNYSRLLANFQNERPQNIWLYHAIEVCGHDLTITRGYGGYPGLYGATETALIMALAKNPELVLQNWSVGYGGEGYAGGSVATGTTAAGLIAYLRRS